MTANPGMTAFAFVLGPGVRYEPVMDDRHRHAIAWPDLQAWLKYLALGGYAARTLDAYERDVAVLLRRCPHLRFSEFTDAHISDALLTFPAAGRLTKKSAFSGWFKWGYQQRLIDANPVDRLPSIKYQAPQITAAFSPSDVTALCGLPFPDGELMTLLFWTGIRRAEACNLTARRLDFKSQRILIKEGAKGSKDREIPMFAGVPEAAASLVTLEGLNPGDYVWYRRLNGRTLRVSHDRPVPSTSYHLWWTACIDAAAVDYLKPHSTRHTFARHLREIGVAIEDIQFLLGHTNLATTMVYARSTVESVGARVAARIAGSE